jgi:hypothetical protein
VKAESVSSTIRSPSSSAPDIAATALAPTSERRAAVRLGSVPINSSEELRFVQGRLALFGKTVFFISLAFLVIKGAFDLMRGDSRVGVVGRISHALATLIVLALWRVAASRRAFSEKALAWIDIAATLGVCVCFAVMAHSFLQPWGAYVGILAVGYTIIGRAVTVPSAPLKTLLLGVAGSAVLSVSVALMQPPEFIPEELGVSIRTFMDTVLWSLSGTVLAGVASKVI